MARLLKLEQGALPYRLNYDFHLQIESFRIHRKGIRNPSPERASGVLPASELPRLGKLVKYLFPDGDPQTPQERLLRTEDWNFQTSPDEEPRLIDNALIASNHSSCIPRISNHVRVHVGKFRRKAQRQSTVDLPAGRALVLITQRVTLAGCSHILLTCIIFPARAHQDQNCDIWRARPPASGNSRECAFHA